MNRTVETYISKMLTDQSKILNDEEIAEVIAAVLRDMGWTMKTSDECGRNKIIVLGLLGLITYGRRINAMFNCNGNCQIAQVNIATKILETFGGVTEAHLSAIPKHNEKPHPEIPQRTLDLINRYF